MAKSNLVKANEKVAETVTGVFSKIEHGVVGTYTQIEDTFVEACLAKDGETAAEAKKRLRQERSQREGRKK